jgi:hypothetical protein
MFVILRRKEFEELKERVDRLERDTKFFNFTANPSFLTIWDSSYKTEEAKIKDVIFMLLDHLGLQWKITKSSEKLVLEKKEYVGVVDCSKSHAKKATAKK